MVRMPTYITQLEESKLLGTHVIPLLWIKVCLSHICDKANYHEIIICCSGINVVSKARGWGHCQNPGTTQGSCIAKGGTCMAFREGHNPNTGTTQSGRIAKGGDTHVLVTFLSKGLIEHKAQLEMQDPKEPYVLYRQTTLLKKQKVPPSKHKMLPMDSNESYLVKP